MDRIQIVRSGYERFNAKDFDGVAALFAEDAELQDTLLPGVAVRGRDDILEQWKARFSEASASAIVGDAFETGDQVVAVVSYQTYTPVGVPVGEPLHVLHRFVFSGDRICQLQTRTVSRIPDEMHQWFIVRASS